MSHFVFSRNLPFSVKHIINKKMTSSCQYCAAVKPCYFTLQEPQHLIKTTAPFERLNKYNELVLDFWYPFAFPYPDTSAECVKKCQMSIFGVFGISSFIHSDQGSAFKSTELKRWQLEKVIATSCSLRFNTQGNGQVEKYNGTVWKAVL